MGNPRFAPERIALADRPQETSGDWIDDEVGFGSHTAVVQLKGASWSAQRPAVLPVYD